MIYRCKIVIRIDSASLEGPKITTEKGRSGSIRVGGKVRKKKIALFSDSRAGPASYSESHTCTPLPPTSAALAHAIYSIGNIILIGISERNPIENTQNFRLRRCRDFMTTSSLLISWQPSQLNSVERSLYQILLHNSYGGMPCYNGTALSPAIHGVCSLTLAAWTNYPNGTHCSKAREANLTCKSSEANVWYSDNDWHIARRRREKFWIYAPVYASFY